MQFTSRAPFMLLAGLLILFMQACYSQVPYPTTYEMTTQKKMQAADHWRVLAQDTAKSIMERVSTNQTLYITRESKEPFHVFMANFLEQKLVARGYGIVTTDRPDALPVYIQAKVLQHSDRYLRNPPGMITSLTGGAWLAHNIFKSGSASAAFAGSMGAAAALDYLDGLYTGPLSKREVVITIKILDGTRVVMAENSIYYINYQESWQYDDNPYTPGHPNYPATPMDSRPTVIHAKSMSITGD